MSIPNAYRMVSSLIDGNRRAMRAPMLLETPGYAGGPRAQQLYRMERRKEVAVTAVRIRWAKRAR
jgi:hypothetical protein